MTGDPRANVFREVNERIAEITRSWAWEGGQAFLCECSTGRCTRAIWLTREEYEGIRAEPGRFLTAPGHEVDGEDRIVERHDVFVVIEKIGGKAPAATRSRAGDRLLVVDEAG